MLATPESIHRPPRAFIAHVKVDEGAAKRLAADLEKRGVRVTWLDRLVTPGESWVAQLQREISQSDLVFVLVSPESERSQWVASETALALSQAAQGRTRVVPVLLSRAVHLPPLLQSIQGIEIFDPERSRRQLDALLRSLELPAHEGAAQVFLDDELAVLKSSRAALEKEVALHELQRATWSSVIVAAIAALASAFGLLGVSFSLVEFEINTLQRWALPFGFGVFASVAAFLLFALVRRRLMLRSRYEDR